MSRAEPKGGLAAAAFRERRIRRWKARHSWSASLALFALLLLLVPPPSPSSSSNDRRALGLARRSVVVDEPDDAVASDGRADADRRFRRRGPPNPPRSIDETTMRSEEDRRPVVECDLTSPHSPTPTSAANGTLRIVLRPDLSPSSSDAFLGLASLGYYDGTYVFRAVRGFVIQWGFNPHWKGGDVSKFKRRLPPDPPPLPEEGSDGRSLSNVRGTMSFAGGTPRTGQVFVNLGDNSRLDREGSGTRPFATLDAKSLELADRTYFGYKQGSGQIAAVREGERAVAEKFPHMSRIERCRVARGASKGR